MVVPFMPLGILGSREESGALTGGGAGAGAGAGIGARLTLVPPESIGNN